MSNNRILSIFQSEDGIIWIGTEGGGVNYFDPYAMRFHTISAGNDPQQLNDKMIYAIAKVKDKEWWIGTESGGINIWNDRINQFRFIGVSNNQLPHSTVRAILPSAKSVWVATLGGVVQFSFDAKRNLLIDREQFPALAHNATFALASDRLGRIWIGSYGGADRYNPETGEIDLSLRAGNHQGALPRSPVTHIFIDNQQTIYFATWGGGVVAYPFDDNAEPMLEHAHYYRSTGSTPGLSHDAIWQISKDTQGNLWFATDGGGVTIYHPDKQQFSYLNRSTGLANNVVYGILHSSDGEHWLSTNRGISRITESGEVFNYYARDGLQSSEFNAGAYFQDDSLMAFGGVNGMTWFNHKIRSQNPYPPQTQLVNVRIDDQPIYQLPQGSNTFDNNKLLLNHDNRIVSLAVRALHFANSQANRFRYRLLGFNNEWIEKNNDAGDISIAGLAPGDYVFEAFAISKDGVPDSTPARLSIEVLPAPWQSPWAYALYLSTLLGLFLWYRHSHIQKLQYQQKIYRNLLEIDQLKEQLSGSERFAILGELASNIAHSLRNPLANIRTTAELIEETSSEDNTVKSATLIVSEVDRLSLWVQELLQFTKSKNDSEVVDLVAIARETLTSFTQSQSLTRKKIRFEFNSELKKARINFEPRLFKHMLNSLLSNAVEAVTDNGLIRVDIKNRPQDKVALVVSDNGRGIDDSIKTKIFEASFSAKAHGRGMGLSLVKRICERHHAAIKVESTLGQGTKFIIELSLKHGE